MDNKSLAKQNIYRTILQSMSHPGMVYQLPSPYTDIMAPGDAEQDDIRPGGLRWVLSTLLDHEVTFFVAGDNSSHFERSITQETGSAVSDTITADFIIVPQGKSGEALLQAKRGSLDYPDNGATAILAIENLDYKGNGDRRLVLRGPGIRKEIKIFVSPSVKEEFHIIKEVNTEFPLGIDCIFVDELNRIMCVPRSTEIKVN